MQKSATRFLAFPLPLSVALLILPLLAAAPAPVVAQQSAADPLPIWEIPGDDSSAAIYILSDFVLLGPADFPLPAPIEAAYKRADVILLPLKDDPDPAQVFQRQFAQNAQANVALEENLDEKTWKLLQEFTAGHDASLQSFQSLQPWAAGILAFQLYSARENLQARYRVGQYFATKGRVDGKTIAGLRPADRFFEDVTSLDPADQAAYLRQTLQEIAVMEQARDEFRVNWRLGDIQAIGQLFARSTVENEQVNTLLRDKPAADWIELLRRMHQKFPERVILAIIPLNLLIGPQGVIQQMRNTHRNLRQLQDETAVNP